MQKDRQKSISDNKMRPLKMQRKGINRSEEEAKSEEQTQRTHELDQNSAQQLIIDVNEDSSEREQEPTYLFESQSYRLAKQNSSTSKKNLCKNMNLICEGIKKFVLDEIPIARKRLQELAKLKKYEGKDLSFRMRYIYAARFSSNFSVYFDKTYGNSFTAPKPSFGDQLKPFKAQAEHWAKKTYARLKKNCLGSIIEERQILTILSVAVFYN
jgi:hypothetical protein